MIEDTWPPRKGDVWETPSGSKHRLSRILTEDDASWLWKTENIDHTSVGDHWYFFKDPEYRGGSGAGAKFWTLIERENLE